MNEFWKKIRNTIIAGFLLLLPIFVVIAILKNAWTKISVLSATLVKFLGIEKVQGVQTQPIFAVLLILVLFFIAGLLVRITFLGRFKKWIEENFLELIPGYVTTREKFIAKVNKQPDTRQPVLVKMGNIQIPGLLVSIENGKAVVFIPETPETMIGQVWVVAETDIQKLGAANKDFVNGLKHAGKGLPLS